MALLANLRSKVAARMASILTAEDVVRRIAAECAYVDDRGGVGIRLGPVAVIVRQYAGQFRRAPRARQTRSCPESGALLAPPPGLFSDVYCRRRGRRWSRA